MNFTNVPSQYAKTLLARARAAGCDVNAILAEADIKPELIEDKEEISSERYSLLYRLVMQATHDELFGMFVGGKVPLGAFRLMGLTLIQCSDLQQAIVRCGEFAEICRGMLARFILEVDDLQQEAKLVVGPIRSVDQQSFEKMIEGSSPASFVNSMVAWHRFSEWLSGKTIDVKRIHLMATEGEVGDVLAHHADLAPYSYGQKENAIIYDAKVLAAPVVQDEDSLMAFLRTAPYHLVTEDPQHITTAHKVKNILKKDVSGNMPSAEVVASLLNVSITTLRRQLLKDNTSYQKLKDDCRMEAAFHYLSCLDLSNNDIAEKLGFDEPSAFFRSFKKWTGLTPGEYRVKLSEEDQVSAP